MTDTTIPAGLQAAIDSFAAQRARLGNRRPQAVPEPVRADSWPPKRLNRPVRIGEIPLPWWNSDLKGED